VTNDLWHVPSGAYSRVRLFLWPLGGFCARLVVTHPGLAGGDCGGGAGAEATRFFIVRTTLP
jgi:hypothetical protein